MQFIFAGVNLDEFLYSIIPKRVVFNKKVSWLSIFKLEKWSSNKEIKTKTKK